MRNHELPRCVLVDEVLDRRLQRDGFVVMPLVPPEHVAALRDTYGELHGWSGQGFASDLIVDDPGYRQRTSECIAESLDQIVRSRFTDHTPFLRNFLCKFPGADSDLYIHRDWMYVDERDGEHTYVAWIALEDITGHNGQLRVLRGSHELDPMLRGTDLIAPWLSHTEVIEQRFLSVPVRAGDCVVFDNRLVHASFPNHTDRPRVAAAVGMRRTGTPLVHFRRVDATTAARYDVDEEFFLSATPQGLLAAPPDLAIAEVIDVVERPMDATQLAHQLDVGMLNRVDRLQHQVRTAAETSARRGRDGLARVRSAGANGLTGARRRASSLLSPGAAGTDRAAAGQPTDAPLRDRVRAQVHDLPTKAAIAVLGLNEASINAFGPATPAIWDPSQFEWATRIEAGYPEIRREVEALLAGPREIPHIEDVTGGIPQGNEGPWRSFVLMHQGRWMDWNCERCPRTTELVRSIPGLTMAGFSVLEPGTHITEHRGPNKGALRYQLGVIVPGRAGDCRIRVGDEMIVWRDGEGCMFDFTVPHEAWNDSQGIRVLLMLEVLTPLPWYLSPSNRLAQRAMGWFPTTRDMTRRLRALEPSLTKRVDVA